MAAVYRRAATKKVCFERAGSSKIKVHMTNRLNRFCRALIALLVLLELSATAQTIVLTNSLPRAIPRRPSFILIVASGLGYGDLSCYGQTKFQTPNLDKLAAEGIRFTNYTTADAATLSQAAFLLGNEPKHLRQNANAAAPLTSEDRTVAQILKNTGYHTGYIGDWNLGGENSPGAPWRQGFDEFAGYFDPDGANHFYSDYIFRYAPNAIYDETNKQFNTFIGREPIVPNRDDAEGQFIPDMFAKAACNFIKDNIPDEFNHYRPFFLMLRFEMPGNNAGHPPSDAPYSDETWPQPERNKAAEISRLDDYIGRIREQLTKLNMTNNAVILFTSDAISQKANGANPAFFHSNVSTNDFRVPMIVYGPGVVTGGRVSGLKWSPKDFLPTVMEMGYAGKPRNIDGVSIVPELRRKR